jgi:hypothetical protein
MVTYRLWKRTRTRPQRAVCKRRLRRCEKDRLRVNHTFCMPAKVGPKRVRALAQAGCYFDGSAAGCGVELFDLRRERWLRSCNRDCDARVCGCSVRSGFSTSLRARRSNPFFLSLCRRMDCFASLAMTVDKVSHSRGADRPRFAFSLAPKIRGRREDRVARCTRGLVCKVRKQKRTRAYRFSGNTPAFPAQWLYGL